jgi:Xaa-Pro aminopeptidase
MDVEQHRSVQNAAKNVLAQLANFIAPDSTEKTIAVRAQDLLEEAGIRESWYYNIPALVLLGSRSCLSVSGRDYEPMNERVGQTNLVTVDLSPRVDDVWGDLARSFFVENGICGTQPALPEFVQGHTVELELHQKMMIFVTPQTKFSELYEYGNGLIKNYRYENLDFQSNLGHSIETSLERRRFIDRDCDEQLGGTAFFTFEPHIREPGGTWGFKHENIYFFDEHGRVMEL